MTLQAVSSAETHTRVCVPSRLLRLLPCDRLTAARIGNEPTRRELSLPVLSHNPPWLGPCIAEIHGLKGQGQASMVHRLKTPQAQACAFFRAKKIPEVVETSPQRRHKTHLRVTVEHQVRTVKTKNSTRIGFVDT